MRNTHLAATGLAALLLVLMLAVTACDSKSDSTADPCNPNPCQELHRSECVADATSSDGYFCSCDSGYTDDGTGNCVSDTPDGDTDEDMAAEQEEDWATDGDLPAEKEEDKGGFIEIDGDSDVELLECYKDTDCFGNEWCDTTVGKCKARKRECEPCIRHEECGYDKDLCLPSGVCGHDCSSGSGYTCRDNYVCTSFPELGAGVQQCSFGEGGAPGGKGSACCSDAHCQEPYICYALTGKCIDGCKSSTGCAPGTVCVDEDPNDNLGGHCKEGCVSKRDCEAGNVCINGACVLGDCGEKADCPLEYTCDTEKRLCVPGCDVNGDCYAQNECIDHECKRKIGCEGTWECPLAWSCTTELPDGDPEDRGCCFHPKQDETKIDDRTCTNPWGPQKFCDVCTDTDNSKKECGQDNLCAQLKDKDDKPLGYFCIIKWDCTTNHEGQQMLGTVECPRGYTCVYMEGDNMQGKFCIADCTKSVFQETPQ